MQLRPMLKNKKGFTLIEIAIVLLIISILLGYTLAMAPKQQELKQFKQAQQEMAEISEALYAFAQIKGYLPCPAYWTRSLTPPLTTSNGFECRALPGGLCNGSKPEDHNCGLWFGAVPAKTLGIDGKYSNTDFLIDPWGSPYLYQVTNVDSAGTGLSYFVMPGGMKSEGIENLDPDLTICNVDPSLGVNENDRNCGGGEGGKKKTVFGSPGGSCTDPSAECAPAVILSRGKRNRNETSTNERENLDNGTNDTVFIATSYSDDFDDIVKWISPNVLYSKMIEAGQLP